MESSGGMLIHLLYQILSNPRRAGERAWIDPPWCFQKVRIFPLLLPHCHLGLRASGLWNNKCLQCLSQPSLWYLCYSSPKEWSQMGRAFCQQHISSSPGLWHPEQLGSGVLREENMASGGLLLRPIESPPGRKGSQKQVRRGLPVYSCKHSTHWHLPRV